MTEAARRRRAMMTAKDAGTPISELEPGTGVKFGVAEFIYVAKTSAASYIMRKNVIGSRKFYETAETNVDYDGCGIDAYLSGTWYDAFPQNMQRFMVNESVSYLANNNGTTAAKTIRRKIFAPSKTELESTAWLNALKAYYGVTSANSARIAKDSADTARKYWTRDAYNAAATRANFITDAGAVNYQMVTIAAYTRPVIALNHNTPFALVDGVWKFAG